MHNELNNTRSACDQLARDKVKDFERKSKRTLSNFSRKIFKKGERSNTKRRFCKREKGHCSMLNKSLWKKNYLVILTMSVEHEEHDVSV